MFKFLKIRNYPPNYPLYRVLSGVLGLYIIFSLHLVVCSLFLHVLLLHCSGYVSDNRACLLVSLVTVLYAQSPSPEWENSLKQQRLILYDLDQTSKTEGEYKRFNTLAHYQVGRK